MICNAKYDTSLEAMIFIAYLLARKIQFTSTFEMGQINVCYAAGELIELPEDFDATWRRILNAITYNGGSIQ